MQPNSHGDALTASRSVLILPDAGLVALWLRKRVGSRWECVCDCGKVTRVQTGSLGTHTHSCGCLQSELASARRTTHGKTKTSTFNIWAGMKDRCFNSRNKNWNRYGGRGITVCPQWKESFERFLLDMGESPKGLTIDRINNDGNYEPGNCRWTTYTVQANNRKQKRNPKVTLSCRWCDGQFQWKVNSYFISIYGPRQFCSENCKARFRATNNPESLKGNRKKNLDSRWIS